MQMQASPILSLSPSSPSFNTCSSGRLAEIAARVVEEFRQESGSCHEDDIYETWPEQNQHYHQPEVIHEEEEDEEEDDDFEFAFVCKEPETSPIISADEIFYKGQIRPIYPLFNTKLLNEDENIQTTCSDGKKKAEFSSSSFGSNSKPKSHRSPLRKLMSEDRESASSSSSNSEADELDGLAPGSYCVWKPKGGSSGNDQETPGRCKKSNSTGSSKRWKLRDLLYRSNSDGKDTFVFLAPSKREKTGNSDVVKEIHAGKLKEADQDHFGSSSSRDMMKTEEKRKSFLPYRQDLVGIFSNVNGLSRNLHPF